MFEFLQPAFQWLQQTVLAPWQWARQKLGLGPASSLPGQNLQSPMPPLPGSQFKATSYSPYVPLKPPQAAYKKLSGAAAITLTPEQISRNPFAAQEAREVALLQKQPWNAKNKLDPFSPR